MKNYILFIALLLGIITATTSIKAQVPGFTLGPKAGLTVSMFQTDLDIIKEEAKGSFHWGAFARFGSRAYIQPEILFMDRSGILVRHDELSTSEQTLRLRTIDVPVLLGVRIIDLKLVSIRLFAGPVASMAINREVELSNWEDGLTDKDLRRANWGVQFGGGVDLLMFTFDLRYETGMGNYSKPDDFELKNNLITLSVGWKIM